VLLIVSSVFGGLTVILLISIFLLLFLLRRRGTGVTPSTPIDSSAPHGSSTTPYSYTANHSGTTRDPFL
jgi:hypothetical protein